MTEEKIEEFLFQINGTLSKIETKLGSVCEVLAQHENRITNLENNRNGQLQKASNDEGKWKNELLMLLAKSVIIGLTAISSLVGASSLISQVLNQSPNVNQVQVQSNQ